MKYAERIVIVSLLLVLFGGSAWLYFTVTGNQAEVREAVARGDYQIPDPEPVETDSTIQNTEDWRRYYPVTVPIVIGEHTVAASVADSLPERIQGLSDTPYLPEGLVKLFVFGALGQHSIWMKDMKYSIDVLWVAKEGQIVHIEENISPETYPKSFSSPTPAWYVIEANAGFVAEKGIVIGDEVLIVQ